MAVSSFFFSSRRRHTISLRDWSSDVCSSDLARFGLNAGFDMYDDRVQGASANLDIVQRTAEAVLAPAYAWIAQSAMNPQSTIPNPQPIRNPQSAIRNSPWFVWVHLYDPHEPYTPPEPLVAAAPTMLDLVGAPAAAADGRSLRPLVGGDPAPDSDPGSYFEALNGNLTRNWAPLEGIVRNRVKLVDLPIPELYDLDADPHETKNLYASQRDRARDLEARLDRLDAARAQPVPRPGPLDGDADARLRSLGYVVGGAPRPARAFTAADDPKRLVHLNTMLDDAAGALA